ncbi:hypothetical protein MXD59_12705 [Frankia sp. Ag45/Mut15]|uniref:Uncharacterized protein n=1 Tax=Frankia umida TaxID=573489 RepID=A0ABT0JYK8_9ACTN|nr:hypothetical protein [Frankia umida]MCK9876628.1 hypothetical protein [Frankia umida]
MNRAVTGGLAVARRRALLAESRFVMLAQDGASPAVLGAARRATASALAELAAIEAAVDAVSGGPDRAELSDRAAFAAERFRALRAGETSRPVPAVAVLRSEVFAEALAAFAAVLAADGVPPAPFLAAASARAWSDVLREFRGERR